MNTRDYKFFHPGLTTMFTFGINGNKEKYKKFVVGYNVQMHNKIKHLEFEED